MVGQGSKLLTPMEIRKITGSGRHSVGNGLYIQISKTGTRSWIFRYQINKLRHEMGLGSANDVNLSEARKLVKYHKGIIREGLDPKIQRDKTVLSNMLKQSWTFDMCADAFIAVNSKVWSNPKHCQQWANTLKTYASPVLGAMPVEEIDNHLIMRVLEPIWFTKTETATRVRSRIERVLSWAIVQGYRDHPNPAIWRGNLKELLPKPAAVSAPGHHSALPYKEIALFMEKLNKLDSTSAKALGFTIATACRTNEAIGATWAEIDMKAALWMIPASRMKTKKRDHRVPLNKSAMKILNDLPKLSGWVFPSAHNGKHISNMTMLNLLKGNLGHKDITVHGFRSSFRDWAAEVSGFPRELAEAALAHVLADKTEAAYQRGDLLEKRRHMMNEWSDYLGAVGGNIVRLKA